MLFLQEIKMQADQRTEDMDLKELGCTLILHPAQRKGYSGVAVYSRIRPDRIWQGSGSEFDDEGRVMRLDIGNLSMFGL